MANITRIKAQDTRKKHDSSDVAEAEVVAKVKAADQATKAKVEQPAAKAQAEKVKTKAPTSAKTEVKKADKGAAKTKKAKKAKRGPLHTLTKPFRAVGRYFRDSWRELRQVRWPSRKAAWKMTLAVLVYCAIFIVLIMGLDLLFTELFGWILG